MEFLIPSLIAGLFTGLAPCILPILPIILGGSVSDSKNKLRPYIIIGSLGISIIIFTLLLRQSTRVLGLSDDTLSYISGVIIILVGMFTLLPTMWEKMTLNLNLKSQKTLGKYSLKNTNSSAILTGLALGPIFISCSPTYGLIISQVFPQSFLTGLVNLVVYSFGLGIFLLAIAVFGQKFISKLGWALDPKGLFRRILSILFIFIGLAIILGWDKDAEIWLLDNFAPYRELVEIEEKLIDDLRE